MTELKLDAELLEGILHQILPEKPLLTSKNSGCNHLFLAHYQQHPGYEMREHSTPFHVLEVIDPNSSSSHKRRIGDCQIEEPLKGGEVFFCPAQADYLVEWKEKLNFTLLAFAPKDFEELASEKFGCSLIEFTPKLPVFDQRIHQLVSLLRGEIEQGFPNDSFFIKSIRDALASVLLKEFAIVKGSPFYNIDKLSNKQLLTIQNFVKENLANDVKWEEWADLAKNLGINPYHLNGRFKQSTGISLSEYLEQERIKRAKYLLTHTNSSLTEIAVVCGFRDASYLNDRFETLVGITPTKFRLITQEGNTTKFIENGPSVAFLRYKDEQKLENILFRSVGKRGKRVTLKLVKADFEKGFSVIFQIGEDGEHPTTEVSIELPPAEQMTELYYRWQLIYQKVVPSPRARVKQTTQISKDDFDKLTKDLKIEINSWFNSDAFRSLGDKLFQKINQYDEIRVLIQSANSEVFRIPWHLWNFFETYPKSELAFAISAYEKVEILSAPKKKVRILAILGDDRGINVEKDRQFLESLPDCQPIFLVNPTRLELSHYLQDEQGWDIFCFSGHSDSENGGQFYVKVKDETKEEKKIEVLNIQQLKYALQKSIQRGLQLAIFNSCDGLELARSLADLNIPQILVMREPIPDPAAQEFLKNFLTAFSKGQSFHLAVRQARENLQKFESQYPCASWLPVIFQNPALIPKTWQQLRGIMPWF